MVLWRRKEPPDVNINGIQLNQMEKFKYLEIEFLNNTRQNCEIARRIGAASGILRSFYQSIVTKKEVSQRTKMAIFNVVYRSTPIYGHEQWVMAKRIRSRI